MSEPGHQHPNPLDEDIKQILVETFAPAIDARAPYAKAMFDQAARRIVERINSNLGRDWTAEIVPDPHVWAPGQIVAVPQPNREPPPGAPPGMIPLVWRYWTGEGWSQDYDSAEAAGDAVVRFALAHARAQANAILDDP